MQPRDLSSHVEYVAGRGREEVAAAYGFDPSEMVTLSSNENPLGPPDAAVAAIRRHADRVHRYPKAAHTALTERLADRWSVTSEQVWLASGGDGALDYLSRAMLTPGDAVLVPDPGFAYYGMSARFHHGDVRQYSLERTADFVQTADTVLEAYDGERIVYITSPHNPTGRVMPRAELRQIAADTDPDTLIVVDEAYGEFADEPSAATLLDERDDVAVLRSFSKAYGLAGLRLGYALVPAEWATAYRRVNTPFAVNELACRSGIAVLEDDDHVARSVELARWGREFLQTELAAETWPSQGNFVLADVGDAEAVTEALLERGIIVRDCSSFGLPRCIRITVGRRPAVRTAVEECNDVLAAREVRTGCESA